MWTLTLSLFCLCLSRKGKDSVTGRKKRDRNKRKDRRAQKLMDSTLAEQSGTSSDRASPDTALSSEHGQGGGSEGGEVARPEQPEPTGHNRVFKLKIVKKKAAGTGSGKMKEEVHPRTSPTSSKGSDSLSSKEGAFLNPSVLSDPPPPLYFLSHLHPPPFPSVIRVFGSMCIQ